MAKKITIIYHNDQDGFASALAAWKKFKNKARYFGVMHGVSGKSFIPEKIKGNDVYLLDFCYTESEMEIILGTAKKLVVIDHHESRKEEVKISTGHIYSPNKRSAAVLSWNYFFPDQAVPKIVRYVEDMDLWKWKLPKSKEISAYMELLDFNFKEWDKFAAVLENLDMFKKVAGEGAAILKYKEKLVSEIYERAEEVVFEGKKAFVVNSPVLRSEIGDFIFKNKKSMAIIWYQKKKNIIRVSLRGSEKINLAKMAEKYGGGGHKAAAGFLIESNIEFPWEARN